MAAIVYTLQFEHLAVNKALKDLTFQGSWPSDMPR